MQCGDELAVERHGIDSKIPRLVFFGRDDSSDFESTQTGSGRVGWGREGTIQISRVVFRFPSIWCENIVFFYLYVRRRLCGFDQ